MTQFHKNTFKDSFNRKWLALFIALCIGLTYFTVPLNAQVSVWTGTAASETPFEPFNTFYWNGNWQANNPPTGDIPRSMEFGQSDWYTAIVDDNDGDYYRVGSLMFKNNASSYILSGERLILDNGSVLRNESASLQTIHTDLQFGLESSSNNIVMNIETIAGELLWIGDATKSTSGTLRIYKTGLGTFTVGGVSTLDLGADSGFVHYQGEIKILAQNSTTNISPIALHGGNLRIVGMETGDSAINTSLGFFVHNSHQGARYSKIIVDPNGGDSTQLNITGMNAVNTSQPFAVHFDLSSANSSVHFSYNDLRRYNNVVPVYTVTDTSGKTGFATLVSSDGGWNVSRLSTPDDLPTTGNYIYSGGANYQVALSGGIHSFTPGNVAANSLAGWSASTLTLKGNGTLDLTDRYLVAPFILIEEGTGNFTVEGAGLAIAYDHPFGHDISAYDMRIFSHRASGDGKLIINTNHIGFVLDGGHTSPASIPYSNILNSKLAVFGHGTTIIRSETGNLLGGIYVQDGRLQIESDAFQSSGFVEVYEQASLSGSGQIGGGDKWVWVGANAYTGEAVHDGTTWVTVNVYTQATLDATPTEHITSSLRGLQIYGSVFMDNDSALSMTLTSDVLAGNYNPLRVHANNPSSTVISLNGDLQVALQQYLSTELWVTLVETDGLMGGFFTSVNGGTFGDDNHFVLTYGGIDYDFYLHYNHDLGGGLTGLVLQAIPEPSTITLIFAVAIGGLLLLRKNRKKVE